MAAPHLTFACELAAGPLQALFTDTVISDLVELHSAVSLALLDLSAARAEVVRRLNAADVPVIAWLVLPREQGYYFNVDNPHQAIDSYEQFRGWARREGLRFAGVGLDIEPDLNDFIAFKEHQWNQLPKFLSRFFRWLKVRRARKMYTRLVEQIRNDGYLVETYQYPLIVDERLAHTSLIQRLTGMVDIPSDREVLMLYSVWLRPRGAAVLASYAGEADAVGVGITGGGVSGPGIPEFEPLTWDEFARDLRLAYHYSDQIFIFSLEGCVEHGYMEKLKEFIWDQPILLPDSGRLQVDAWRASLASSLWLAERLPYIIGGITALILTIKRLRGRHRNKDTDHTETTDNM